MSPVLLRFFLYDGVTSSISFGVYLCLPRVAEFTAVIPDRRRATASAWCRCILSLAAVRPAKDRLSEICFTRVIISVQSSNAIGACVVHKTKWRLGMHETLNLLSISFGNRRCSARKL
eukprot:scaffold29941_cov17-Prasinocladus_malaysianus.AAC.1